jgi:hypothetical protein
VDVPVDVEEYRRMYTDEVDAVESAVPPADSEPDADLLAAVGDRNRPTAERVDAVNRLRIDAAPRTEVIERLIAVLRDTDDDPEVRRAAVGALQENSFRDADFQPHAAAYLEALRATATDADRTLRERVLEILALGKDEYAQRLLVDGLQDRKAALVAPRKALQLIGYDLHGEHYGMLRDIATGGGAAGVRTAALRLLAADSDSKDLFVRLVRDRSENSSVRATSAAALNSLAPQEFADIARDIVLDDDDDDDLRATCLTALAHGSGERADTDLADRVMASPTAKSGQLTTAARRYSETRHSETRHSETGYSETPPSRES